MGIIESLLNSIWDITWFVVNIYTNTDVLVKWNTNLMQQYAGFIYAEPLYMFLYSSLLGPERP